MSAGAWPREHADALQRVARQAAARSRAVAARGVVVRPMVRHLLDLDARLAALEAAIAAVLAQDEDGQRQQTLPGVGPVIAASVRAELGDGTRFQGVEQVSAYVGLDPRTPQRGACVGQTHLSTRGPGALRHALYLATLHAVPNRAQWRARYRRLLDRGRPTKEALTILARAFRKVGYHLLCTGTSYDPLALLAPTPCPARGRA